MPEPVEDKELRGLPQRSLAQASPPGCPSSLLWPGASQAKPGPVCPVASQGVGAFGRVQPYTGQTSLSSLSPESRLHWMPLGQCRWSPAHPELLDTAECAFLLSQASTK